MSAGETHTRSVLVRAGIVDRTTQTTTAKETYTEMKKLAVRQGLLGLALGGLIAAGALSAPVAHADELFIVCPSGHSGVATTVTSCLFADNVREGYLSQGGPFTVAYSPVTQQVYDMQCIAGFVSHLNNGQTVTSVRCVGGNDAVVVLW